MRNSTKLKIILEIYSLSIEMDDDEAIHVTAINKLTGAKETFIDKTYTRVIEKVFAYMKKQLKESHSSL